MVLISRTNNIDDDGSGTTGTVFNNAWKSTLYNEIDNALALLLPITGGNVTGAASFATTVTFNGKADHKAEFAISDAGQAFALAAGDTNDKTLNASVTTVTVTSNDPAGSTLTGMTGGYQGRMAMLLNIGSTGTLWIANESSSSSAANRFASAVTLLAGECATFLYTNRWRRVG